MQNKQNNIFALLLAGGVGLAASGASAAILPSLPTGPLYFDYTGVEQVSGSGYIQGANGVIQESNWGIIQVGSIYSAESTSANKLIQKSGSSPLWTAGMNGGQILGIFYGINLMDMYGNSSGGHMDLYWIPSGNFNMASFTKSSPTSRLTSISTFTGITDFAGAVKLISADFAAGVASYTDSRRKQITVAAGGVDPTSGSAGTASSYLNAVSSSGLWSSALESNWFHQNLASKNLQTYYNGYTDMFSTNNFAQLDQFDDYGNPTYVSPWDNADLGVIGLQISNGSLTVNMATSTSAQYHDTIPEPGTLASMSLGLTSLALALRRRRR